MANLEHSECASGWWSSLGKRALGLLLICLCLTAGVQGLQAGENRLIFSQISIEEGLSQSIVSCIIQDGSGFMWFGTEDGLNRYDGYRITVMRHDPKDPNSLSYNEILSIHEDKSGILWIGTFNGGLNRYDPVAKTFTHYKHDPGDPHSISHDVVRSTCEDSSGRLWVGTDGGLNRLDPGTGQFTRYLNDSDDPTSLSHDAVLSILEDRSGTLWVGTDGGGLNRYDPGKDAFFRFRTEPGNRNTPGSEVVRAICEGADGSLWIGTDAGLAGLDEDRRFLAHYANEPENKYSLGHDQVYTLFENGSGSLWVGTNGGGLNRLDHSTEEFTRYVNDPNDDTSITYDQIRAIYKDRSGVIWIGTYGGGVNKFDSKRKRFKLYRPVVNDSNSLSHEIVWSFHEDADGYLWIGTHGGGLDRLDRRTNQYVHFRHDPGDPGSLSHDIVRVVYEDHAGALWLGTNGGGICRFDRDTGRFTTFRHDPADPSSLSHDQIRSIYEDSRGTLWIGTNGNGLNRFNPRTQSFKQYTADPGDPQSLSNGFVRVIYEDTKGRFWLGTQGGGLNRFDRENETFATYRTDPGDSNTISNDFIFSIHEDTSGRLWLGTWGGGLIRFDVDEGTFKSYTTEDGLASNAIYGVLEDDFGHLWMSTNNGLSMFDHHTQTFKHYNVEDGLQSNEFNGGSFHKNKNGEMFFGGIQGFNAFFPDEIHDNPYVPQVAITSFQKLNREVELDRPLSEMDQLILSYRDFTFSFEFAALDYTAPRKNIYAYKMVGLHDDWIMTPADKRSATFTTLPPGKYTFMVKGSNNDGVWNEIGASIKVIITPPFWKTWWFRFLVVALAILVVRQFYLWRLRSVRLTAEMQSAHDAQMSIMPQEDPRIEGYDISGICIPANEVGGDFYDIFWQDKEKTKLGVFVGDVSGKAMQAAMIAVMSSGMVYSRADESSTPRDILTHLNRPLHTKTSEVMFTALCFGSINVPTREFTYALAGMNQPILKSGDEVTSISTAERGLPLGAFEDSEYADDTVRLNRGDVIVLFTDGVIEAQNRAEDFYDDDRLEALVAKLPTADLSASDIKDRIVQDVNEFTANAEQQDDLTLVVIKAV